MKNERMILMWIFVLYTGVSFVSCNKFKEDFLNVKQNPTVVSPETIRDYQALLDNASSNSQQDAWMNITSSHQLGMVGGDELTVEDQTYSGLADNYVYEKNTYIWKQEFYGLPYAITKDDWFNAYKRIYHCNIVLDGIDRIRPGAKELDAWNNVKGSALFYRALNFYDLVQEYGQPYHPQSSKSDLGIALRETADISVKSVRGSVEDTYLKIIEDLEAALPMLPDFPLVNFRPSKMAVYTLLARAYVQMGNFDRVLHYTDLALRLRSTLLDFSTINLDLSISFMGSANDIGKSNPEIFYFCTLNAVLASETFMTVSDELLALYRTGDLRYRVYFRPHATKGNMIYKGSYSGTTGANFTGMATSELWLMRAEAYARLDKPFEAMADLNHLLKHRFEASTFQPLVASSADQALRLVLDHRRKELVFRGTRWSDLRRLNKDPRFAKTLVRVLEGVRHELPPDDPRWVWPIPLEEIDLSKMEQNPR